MESGSGAHLCAVRPVRHASEPAGPVPPQAFATAALQAAEEVAHRLDRALRVRVAEPTGSGPAVRLDCHGRADGLPGPVITARREPADGTAGHRVRVEVTCPPEDPWRRCAPAVAEMLGELLAALLADPDLPPSGGLALAASSRAVVLAAPEPGPEAFRSVPEQVWDTAARTPDAPAVHHAGRTLTYRQLVTAAATLSELVSAGLVPGGAGERPIPVLIGDGLALPVAYLALMRHGTAYVPLDPGWPRQRMSGVLDVLAAPVVLCLDAAAVPAAHRSSALVVDVAALADGAGELPEFGPGRGPDELVYGMFTSGTTGTPRCALNRHGGLANRLAFMNRWFGAAPGGEVVLQNTRHTFDSAFWQLFWPLTTGGATVVPGHGEYLDLRHTIDLVEAHGVTVTDFVPTVLGALLAVLEQEPAQLHRLRTLRHLVVGGEEINPHTVHRLRELLPGLRVSNGYGPTEASIGMIFHEVLGTDGADVPLGRPIDGCLAVVVDADLRPLPPGATGELLIGGACLGAGYLDDPVRTAERFVPNPWPHLRHHSERLYRTGDLAHRDAAGRFHFDGRIDHQVKIGGIRVELGEIEVTAQSCAGVRYATALAVGQGADRELVLVAAGPDLRADVLRAHLRERLPRSSVPQRLLVLDELPLTGGDKVDRTALAALVERQRQAPAAGTGDDPVLGVLRRVLRRPELGEDDHFFDAGGNSLQALAAASELSRVLEVEVGVRDLFDHPTAATVRRLALERGRVAPPDPDALVAADLAAPVAPAVTAAPACPHGDTAVRTVLLTGATGFVGTRLLYELLERTDVRVLCLVRGDGPDPAAHARARLTAAMRAHRLHREAHAGRVEVVAGDLARPGFGLDAAAWQRLASECDLLLHNGALVNLLYDYRMHREANVLGTAEMIRLARTGRGIPLHHVSTLGALHRHARQHAGEVVAEDVDVATVVPPSGGYSRSKWAAEQLLAAAAAAGGAPVTVLRLGEVLPATDTGLPNPQALTHLLLASLCRVGVAPEAALRSDYSPVDEVAAAVVAAVVDRAVWGGRLHVFRAGSVAFEALLDEQGVPLPRVPCTRFVAALRRATARGEREPALLLGVLDAALAGVGAAEPHAADEVSLRAVLEDLLQDNPALFGRAAGAELERRAGLPSDPDPAAAYRVRLRSGRTELARV